MYYIAMDGGGTKLVGLLFDHQYRLISAARAAGTHASVYSSEQIDAHIRECYDHLFADLPRPLSVECLYTVCGNAHLYATLLPAGVTLQRSHVISEGVAGLYAAAPRHEGFVALAGTGSDAFCIRDDRVTDTVGGWGAILGDEGSGVWMARRAMAAAIHAEQGWGPPTVFGELVKRHYRFRELWDYVDRLYGAPAPFRMLGELLPLVAEAARQGDRQMQDVFREGGRLLARQTAVLLARYPDMKPRIVACGGAWKAHPLMAESFSEAIAESHPAATFTLPRFEHIMAGPIRLLMELGEADEAHLDRLAEHFPHFVWNPYKEAAYVHYHH